MTDIWDTARIPDDRENSAIFDYISGKATGEHARTRAALNYTTAVLGTILEENDNLRKKASEGPKAFVTEAMKIQGKHLEMMAAAFLKATSLDPTNCELVQEMKGMKMIWYYRARTPVTADMQEEG